MDGGGKPLPAYFPERVIYFGIQWGEREEGKEEPQYSSGFLDQQLVETIFLMTEFKSQTDWRVKEKVHHLTLSAIRRRDSVLSMLFIGKVRKTFLSRLIPIDSPLFGYE